MGSSRQDWAEMGNEAPKSTEREVKYVRDAHSIGSFGSLIPPHQIVNIDPVKKVENEMNKEYDNINSPKHYQLLPGVEVIDVRKAIFKQIPEGTTPFAIDCYSRALEYLMRMWSKNGLEDAQKARTYLNWLITELTEGNKK